MKLKGLSHYNNDKDTRFGDCILLYNDKTLMVYDCGHEKHSDEIKSFLENKASISQIHLVVSHNDSDHTDGFINLMEYLHKNKYDVDLYSSLYLKSVEKISAILDDDRRTPSATKERILKLFDNIKTIVEKAEEYNFTIENATVGRTVSSGRVVGPTEDEFVSVVAKAIEDGAVSQIEGENVMNAASVQITINLENAQSILLCGDASPSFLHNLEKYHIIQLPHHGKLNSAIEIFDELKDPTNKDYFISDNTGTGTNSGGSNDLVKYMSEENYSPAYNTKNDVVLLPEGVFGIGSTSNNKPKGVKLGEMDYWF